MDGVRFYYGYVKTNINEPFIFEIKELEIKTVFEDGTIMLEYPYFYNNNDSTYYFGGKSGRNTDVELNLRNGLVFYSTDFNKCRDFVLNKMKEMNKVVERMIEAKLEIKLLGENNNHDE